MKFQAGVLFSVIAFCAISSTSGIKIATAEFDATAMTGTNATEAQEVNVKRIGDEIAKYRNYMDVIVFPEYSVTGLTTDYARCSIHVPKIEAEKPDYQSIIKRLSNMAVENQKYVIVHVLENATDNNIYSTAVVFNKDGKIISKHRKLSLSSSERKGLTAGNDTTIVQIEHEQYALVFGEDLFTVAPPTFTDSIIVLSSLVNAIPYESALSLYAAYALRNRKNLIVSGLNHPSTGRSGTAIFLYTNSNSSLSADTFVTGKDAIYEMFGDLTAKTIVRAPPKTVLRGMPDEDALVNLAYVKKSGIKTNQKLNVEPNKQIRHQHFNCHLVNFTSTGDLNNNYKFVQQTGEWSIGNTTYKTAFCGVAVYANNSDATFGLRIQSGLTIDSINLNLTLLQSNATVVYPIALDYNLQPITSLSFRQIDGHLDISAIGAKDVLTVGFLVITDSSAAFGLCCNVLVLLGTLILTRYF